MPITFSSPRVQQEVVMFLVSYKSPYFSHQNTKISASNSLNFGSYSKKCTYFQYTNFYFMNFHNSLISSVKYLFLPQEKKVKSKLEVKLCKMCLLGQGQSV